MVLNNRQRLREISVILAIAVCSCLNFWLISRELRMETTGGVGGMMDGWIGGIQQNHPPSIHARTKNATIDSDGSTLGVAAVKTAAAPLQGTAVIQLWGELGNHLQIFAFYYALQHIASTEFNLNLTLHVRKQPSRKAETAAENAKCLKSFRDLDFDECTWSNNSTKGQMCTDKITEQVRALHDDIDRYNTTIHQLANNLHLGGSTSEDIRSTLRSYVALLTDSTVHELFRTKDLGWSVKEPHPFLFVVDRLHVSDELLNELYSKGLPEYFAFDHTTKMHDGCCALMPEEDEHVFHYRSFIWDLPEKHMAWGGAELRPTKAAELLASTVPPGSKIALVSGRSYQDRLEEYVSAFENRSFTVRKITGQTAIQDFCFLAHARAGLWGTEKSSYIKWASLIASNLQNATLYGVNYPAREKKVALRAPTNIDLAKIVHYPVLDVSDKDVW